MKIAISILVIYSSLIADSKYTKIKNRAKSGNSNPYTVNMYSSQHDINRATRRSRNVCINCVEIRNRKRRVREVNLVTEGSRLRTRRNSNVNINSIRTNGRVNSSNFNMIFDVDEVNIR
jgi:hypothetical protein